MRGDQELCNRNESKLEKLVGEDEQSGGKQQCVETRSSVTEMKVSWRSWWVRMNKRRNPVVEVMIRSPHEAWNEKVSPQIVIRVRAGVRETLGEERHRNED
ncbi:hypothetical protein XENOCAPTIV_026660 [Xenoophorus captivus]|uniref:Uncharacterized protein n=1 Tax=Xenoophorus captivus TaxID=1517983 RepID=A0ABV0SAN0_9TELE